jgi:hypothetical protein
VFDFISSPDSVIPEAISCAPDIKLPRALAPDDENKDDIDFDDISIFICWNDFMNLQ